MATESSRHEQSRRYLRFNVAARLQHLLMLLSFTTLAITGLVQKYALSAISVFIVRAWGGIENIRATHHVAATILMLIAIGHLLDAGYKVFVLRTPLSMLPGLQDIRDALKALLYNVGLAKSRPQLGRYGFEEKAEYWALIWGILVMGLTGFMMWNPLATVRVLPGEFIPAAKTAHGGEAILAVLAIIVWHMYGVHLRRFNKSMWTGHLTEEEMLHEHPLELADLKAGIAGQKPAAREVRRRQLIYYPVGTVIAAGLLFAVYGFVRGEATAITTVPAQIPTLPVYVPQTPTPLPPTPTAPPSPTPVASTATEPITWARVGTIFGTKCGICHSAAVASGGLVLDSYAAAMLGGQSGPVIIPADPDGSKLMAVQSSGGHPGQLTVEEMEIVRVWITAGAPEQ